MNKKFLKVIIFGLVIVLLIGCISITVNAAESASMLNPDSIQPEYVDSGSLTTLAGRIMGFIRNLAVIGGVILLMILGVKYMMGSVEEKADYKKSLVPLVIGILVVMAATQIMTFVIKFFTITTTGG